MQTSTPTTHPDMQTARQFPVFSRQLFLQIAQAALKVKEYRFAQEVILGWLAAFPGDLQASLVYAGALLGNQRSKQAIRVLEGLCQVDPEFVPAVAALLTAYRQNGGTPKGASADPSRQSFTEDLIAQWAAALGTLQAKDRVASSTSWGNTLAHVRHQIDQQEFANAQQVILPILGQDLGSPLPAVTHLHLMRRSGQAPLQAVQSLAEHYLRQWPDCLVFKLYIAESLLESGETARGVALLHEAARRDIAGQVPTRLWGAAHRYQSLWPSRLELEFRWLVPAEVAAEIGWNMLPAGGLVFVAPEEAVSDEQSITLETVLVAAEVASIVEAPAAPGMVDPSPEAWPAPKSLDIHILPVQAELYRIADRLNRPDIKSLDTRYPVYVILTVQQALEAKYGPAAAGHILAEASSLAIKIQSHAARHSDFRWGARLFVADRLDPKEEKSLDIIDAFTLKKAVTRLDADLATHGERIGALLILGGPEIVPFHYLPNPVDDQDEQIASDNPYACRGANYFLPEWPVGRLVDGTGRDPALLLAQIQRLGRAYLDPVTPRRGLRSWLSRVGKSLRYRGKHTFSSFGYTAAVWKPASIAAFKPVGRAHNLYTSPPFGLSSTDNGKKPGKGVPLPNGTYAYFNLHGLVDASEWFGQRDFASGDLYPDYPVAIRPEDICNLAASNTRKGATRLPRIVISEACYGAHIEGKAVDGALSLTFLEAGCEAVVGSTAMSYGSINAPLIGADFLAFTFLSCLQSGMPAGEALRQARLRLAQEMNTRQGYLDGEDQKTLLSFVLYGDPLLQVATGASGRKGITRWSSAPPIEINTICDRACQLATEAALSQDARDSIRQVVAKYLPNMQDASMTVSDQRAACSPGLNCPNHQPSGKSPVNPTRRLVTLSKTFLRPDRSETHIARLTLDQEGKVVKLVVSR